MPSPVALSVVPVATLALPGHQKAFKLGSGETFIVETTRVDLPAPEEQQWIALHIRCWQVDANGLAVGVEMPPHRCSIPLAALADGTASLDQTIADQTALAGSRFQNHLTALQAFTKIPRLADVHPQPAP